VAVCPEGALSLVLPGPHPALSRRERGNNFGKALLVPAVYVHWAKPMAHPVPAGER
jgi:hypothetical protein